jgi:hypothetical protein
MQPSAGNVQKAVLGAGVAGRPVTKGKFAVSRTMAPSGFKIENTEPTLLNQVHTQYLQRFELPPSLQPRSTPLRSLINRRISKGAAPGIGKV